MTEQRYSLDLSGLLAAALQDAAAWSHKTGQPIEALAAELDAGTENAMAWLADLVRQNTREQQPRLPKWSQRG